MVFIADEGVTAGAMGNETYQLNVLKQLQNHLIQMFLVFKKVLLVSFSFFFFITSRSIWVGLLTRSAG